MTVSGGGHSETVATDGPVWNGVIRILNSALTVERMALSIDLNVKYHDELCLIFSHCDNL